MCRLWASADFRILDGNRGTGDDDLGASDVFGAVSFEDCGAESGQALRHRGILQVGAGNFVAEIEQHLGNATHADAADAYEMNALNFRKHKSNSWPRITRIHTDNRENRDSSLALAAIAAASGSE